MTQKIRSAIIGTGFMGQVHSRAVHAAGGVVTAVVSRTSSKAQAAAELFGANRAYATIEEAIAADDVDLIHICTPNESHAPLTHLALAAGKHVICEKPLATSLSEAQALAEAAARSDLICVVPFVYRFYASVRETRARIQRGDAGPLRLLHGSYLQDWLSRPEDTNWRIDPAQGGASRAFADIGVHWCDLVEFTTGHRISSLSANLLRIPRAGVAPGSGTEDAATIIFVTDQGAAGSLTVSQVSPGRKNRLWFSLDGSQASYEFNQEHPDSLWIGGREENILLPRAAPAAISPPRYDAVPTGHPQGYQDSFTALIADVHAAIRGTTPDGLPTFDDGLRAALITTAVIDSAANNSWATIPSPQSA